MAFKDTDKILVHRDGVDYQADLGPLMGGGGTDCDGVFDCLVNSEVDASKYSIVNESALDDHETHMHHQYMVTTDPQTFLPYPVGHEKHNFEGGDKTLFTIKYLWDAKVMIAAPPPLDVTGEEELFGFHPTSPLVKDLTWKRIDDVRTLSNPEDIWTAGNTQQPYTQRNHTYLSGPQCDRDPNCEYYGTSDEDWCDCEPNRTDEQINKGAWVATFKCHTGETYQFAIILWGMGAYGGAAEKKSNIKGGKRA